MSEPRDAHELTGRWIRRVESRERLLTRKVEMMTIALRACRVVLTGVSGGKELAAPIDEALGIDVDAELEEEETVA